MNKMLVGGAVCLSLIFSGALLAEESQKPAGGQKERGNMPREVKTDCPDCQGIVDQIKAKQEEIKKLRDEEQAKLEELKKNDPKKYEELMAKREADRKEMEAKREKQNVKEGDNVKQNGERQRGQRGQRGPSPEQLEKMKTENPEMYKAVMENMAKMKEIMELRAKLKTCEENCKSK